MAEPIPNSAKFKKPRMELKVSDKPMNSAPNFSKKICRVKKVIMRVIAYEMKFILAFKKLFFILDSLTMNGTSPYSLSFA